jgi:DNA/RNA endonuclease YhcR with UshA esterase domain
MKDLKYILFALTCVLFASCMADSYAGPEDSETSPYGNNELTETNVITIAQLKEKYASVIANSGMEKVTEDIKIKGRITGNDIQGNIYNEVAIQDSTGAFLICIAQGGLYGSLPVGQEVLVSLKDLYVGAYGMQGEIGVPYTNASGSTYVSRMSRILWDQHYKLIGSADASKVNAETFNVSKISDETYIAANCGKLMTIYNVKLTDADGKAVYAPNDGTVTLTANCANRELTGFKSSNIVVRTSTYADFANKAMMTGPVSITGIFTRFRGTWQILMRSSDDIAVADPYAGIKGTGKGTVDEPYDVTRALSLVDNNRFDATASVYISGIISSDPDISTSYGNAGYYISDDGKEESQLQVFRGYYLNGDKFTTTDQIKKGQKVVILGKLTVYNGAAEVGAGSKIISIK